MMVVIRYDAYWDKFSRVLDGKLDEKLSVLENRINTTISKQDVRIKSLEGKCNEYEENIETLKSVISKQQRSLTTIDAGDRNRPIIIIGLHEGNITLGEGKTMLENDDQKVFKTIRRFTTVTR